MQFVPQGYRSRRLANVFIRHHPDEEAAVVAQLATLVADSVAALESAVAHTLSCPLGLCIYRESADAGAALGRPVPPTMLMLLADFTQCTRVFADEYEERSAFFKTGVMLSRLLSPIL